MALLEVKNLGISFGGLRAVDQFEINIKKGQLYGLIGPNGAGKTTIFNMLTGVYKPTDGIIKLDGEAFLNGLYAIFSITTPSTVQPITAAIILTVEFK